MRYTIEQTAIITGLSADTLRYYEKEGVIAPKRRENGYRCYDETDIAALKYIVVMKYAHFTLSEIKSMEELQTRDPSGRCNEIAKQILSAKENELRQAISTYQRIVMLFEEILPMIEDADAFHTNQDKINGMIERIFIDISTEKRGH